MDRSDWYAWMVPIAFILPIATRWMFRIWWFHAPIRPLPDRIGRTAFALGVCLMGYLAFVFVLDEPGLYDWETGRRRQKMLLLVAAFALSGPLFAYMHSRRVGTAHCRDGADGAD